MDNDLATRFVGFCPVCEGTFKLRNGALVHHGYERPGDGYIHGDCFTVGMSPHETSPKAAELFKAACEETLTSQKAHLARLEAGEVKVFMRTSTWEKTATIYTAESKTVKNLVTGEEKVTTDFAAYDFERQTEHAIHETKGNIRSTEMHIARMVRHLTDWAPKPLTTWEESVSALKAAKDAAKGTKTAARQAKIAAKIESCQKRIDSAYSRFKKGNTPSKATLADIFESTTHAWHDLGFKSHVEFLGVLNRSAIWTEFGLLLDAPYRSAAYTKNTDTLHDMRGARYV